MHWKIAFIEKTTSIENCFTYKMLHLKWFSTFDVNYCMRTFLFLYKKNYENDYIIWVI
jgi:hypothetical protein